MLVSPRHFCRVKNQDEAAALLKDSLRAIEIEIHSFCNRTCSFCPNSFIDRRHDIHIMDPALYSKIIDDLSFIEFGGSVWYSRYNEPTADRALFLERLREARAKLPRARLQTYSNGDYLTAEYIADLRDAGLNELRIMAYLSSAQPPTKNNFLDAMYDRLERLGLPWKFRSENRAEVELAGIEVSYRFADFAAVGTNRGGSLSSGRVVDRQSPCMMPLTNIYIDYNGAMVPCCDIRSDYEKHRECVVYRLTPENSIIDGYANSALVDWRRRLSCFGDKNFPCNSCSRRTYPDTPGARLFFDSLSTLIRDAGHPDQNEEGVTPPASLN